MIIEYGICLLAIDAWFIPIPVHIVSLPCFMPYTVQLNRKVKIFRGRSAERMPIGRGSVGSIPRLPAKLPRAYRVRTRQPAATYVY